MRNARQNGLPTNGPSFGTDVHVILARRVDAEGAGLNPVAEFSLLKSDAASSETQHQNLYGKLDTFRIDILDHALNATTCVYDIKTGNAKLGFGRAYELYAAVKRRFPATERIVVIEVRPSP